MSTRVGRAAVALIGVALALRAWVAVSGYLYWDDLILLGRGSRYPLLSSDLLLYDHDGHFMPAAFFVAGVVARVSQLSWAGPVVTLLALQAVASLSVLRLLRVLLGDRAVLLLPLGLYLFGPLTMTSFAWWSAALNALPLQIGMAWVCADAVLLCRSGRTRYATTGLIALVGSLAFFEKSVVIPAVAFAVAVLVARVDCESRPWLTTLRQGRRLWIASGVVLAAWAVLYVSTVQSRIRTPTNLGASATLLRRSLVEGLLPALAGGPWAWAELGLSTPFATPPLFVVGLGLLGLAGAVSATTWWKHRVGLVWFACAAYLAFDFSLMVVGRSGQLLTAELALTLRYFADGGLVITVALALVLRSPVQERAATPRARGRHTVSNARPPLVAIAVAAFLVSSIWSTATFTDLWSQGPTRSYLTTAQASLASHSSVPLLDQPVPATILWGLAYPNNLASQIFRPLRHRPAFSASTTKLQLIDDKGAVVPAHLRVLRTSLPGPAPTCGYHVDPAVETVVDLDEPLIRWGWTVRLSFLSAGPGTVTASFDDETPVTAGVVRGPGELFLRMAGQGTHIRLRVSGGVQSLCLGSAMVGLVEPGAFA